MTTVPCHVGLQLTNDDFIICCRLRLGCIQFPSVAAVMCACGLAELDPYGDHLLCCSTGNERNRRHDHLCEVFRQIISSVRIPADREVELARLGVYPDTTDADAKRIDLYWVEEGRGMLGDVTVAHPSRANPTEDNHHKTTNRQNGAENGRALRRAAEKKYEKYSDAAQQRNFKIVPLSAESYGRWGDETAALLHRLARHKKPPIYMEDGEMEFFRDTAVEQWFSRLSVVLQQGNAEMIRSRGYQAARWNGQERAGEADGILLERGPFHPH